MELSDRVDYDTARALKLLGFPQYIIADPDKPKVRSVRIGQPHYVTIYSSNMIHEYIESIHIGHIHGHDVMCYAPTYKEALEWMKNRLEKDLEE